MNSGNRPESSADVTGAKSRDYQDRLERYGEDFLQVIRLESPPGAELRQGLRQLQQSLNLDDHDVEMMEAQVYQDFQAQTQQYQANLQRYQQSFAQAVQQGFPLSDVQQDQFWRLKEALELYSEDVIRVEGQILAQRNSVSPASGSPASGSPTLGSPGLGSPTSANPTSGSPASGSPTSANPTSGNPVPLPSPVPTISPFPKSSTSPPTPPPSMPGWEIPALATPTAAAPTQPDPEEFWQPNPLPLNPDFGATDPDPASEPLPSWLIDRTSDPSPRELSSIPATPNPATPAESSPSHSGRMPAELVARAGLAEDLSLELPEPAFSAPSGSSTGTAESSTQLPYSGFSEAAFPPNAQPLPTGVPPVLSSLPETRIDVPSLESERGIDYTYLHDLLQAQQWEKADEETLAVMLQASGRTRQSWLDAEAIAQFPCTDLKTIDRLWGTYSDEQFSFRIQSRTYNLLGVVDQEGEFGDRFSPDRALTFSKRVGWWAPRVEFLKYYNQLEFNTQAPDGHLPALWFWTIPWWEALKNGGVGNGRGGCRMDTEVINALMKKLEQCEIT